MGSQEKYKPHLGRFKDKDIRVIIGWILRSGVIISMIVVVIGGVLFVYRHGYSIQDYHVFKAVPYHNTSGIINGVLNIKEQAIIQLGILLLIATPIVRVVFSAVGFIIEKDYLYTVITLIVLLIIIGSMLGGK